MVLSPPDWSLVFVDRDGILRLPILVELTLSG